MTGPAGHKGDSSPSDLCDEVDGGGRKVYLSGMRSVVSEKGQVTIPKALRDSLALVPGTLLDFEEEQGKLVARRVVEADPFSALVGLLPSMDVDEALRDMRGPEWSSELDEGRSGHGSR
jgi:AbrB family looped-hinge helix DNA binding protein